MVADNDKLTIPKALTKRPRRKDAKVNVKKALELRLKGVSQADIARHFNCSRSAVTQALAPYRDLPLDQLDAWKSHKGDLLEAYQVALLQSLTPSDIKSMAPASRITAAAILFDKARLQRGESTNNISLFSRIVMAACGDE